jgi:hypothetical protein
MRIQLIILLSLFSLSAFAVDDKSMQDLFSKYDSVMDQKKVDLIDDVFTQKFIRDSGGKQELTDKIKELTTPPSPSKTKMSWKKGQKGEVYLAKVKEISANKMKDSHESEFIVIKEDGKLKIDGTMSDGN